MNATIEICSDCLHEMHDGTCRKMKHDEHGSYECLCPDGVKALRSWVAPNLEAVKELNQQLTMLLEDPQPRLVIWEMGLLRVLEEIAKFVPQRKRIPEVTMQQLIDAGLNAFGLQLFIESIATKEDAKTFNPISFVFRGLRVSFEPEPGKQIDTRHH